MNYKICDCGVNEIAAERDSLLAELSRLKTAGANCNRCELLANEKERLQAENAELRDALTGSQKLRMAMDEEYREVKEQAETRMRLYEHVRDENKKLESALAESSKLEAEVIKRLLSIEYRADGQVVWEHLREELEEYRRKREKGEG